jgi:ATP-binding cassette, subfamily B, bacterial PglK
MTSATSNIGSTVTAIWGLLKSNEHQQAKFFVLLSLVATLLEMLSLGMIFPLLYTISASTQPTSIGMLGSFVNLSAIKTLNLPQILVFLVFLFAAKNIFLVFLARYQARFVFGIEKSISNLLYERYLNQPYPFFTKRNSAELIRNTMREASQFSHNALSPLCLLITETFIVLGVIIILFTFNPFGAIVAFFLFGGAGYCFYSFVRKRIVQWGKEHQFHEGKRLQTLQEGFGSIKEVLIGGLQGKFINAYSMHMAAGANAGVNQQTVQAAPKLFIEFFAVIILALVIIIFGGSDSEGFIPIIGLYAAAAFRLMPGINRIINALQALRYSHSTVQLLVKELCKDSGSTTSVETKKIGFKNKIELINISFSYPDTTKFLLNDINLEINKGDLIFLSGQSGSGKTTLVDVICGLQKPTKGEILVDGISIAACIQCWQRSIAYVPQTTFLLDGSILENIVFGDTRPNVDLGRLTEVCRVARVDEIISGLPKGIETRIGERGGSLSGGQRQRIGIARALYRGGELLVLDEATNALDNALEQEVCDAIIDYMNGKTLIWISHNTLSVSNAKIILVDGGKVRKN